ncbi:hypothetical protein ACFL3J_01180 [Candidatus Omnitrophota bacterium]
MLLALVLILTTGILASIYFFSKAGLLERLGSVMFFSLALAPFININLSLLGGIHVANEIAVISSLVISFLFLLLLLYKKKKTGHVIDGKLFAAPEKSELFAFVILIAVTVYLFFYYSNLEFIMSLASYIIKGDAECFYMQTFETAKDFKGALAPLGANNNAYGIICTPGNILFTSSLISIFKMYSFKIAYMPFLGMLFIFVYLLVKRLINNNVIAVFMATFSVLNPYVLSVEVLDRNVMALAISAVFFYILLKHKKKIFLHGLVFGILAGTGLRFLPLLFFLPAIMLYTGERLPLKKYLVFLAGFIVAFAFNIPHLYFHGFQSLGETRRSADLLVDAFTKWQRTPFLPFPNIIFYIVNIINYFGYLFTGLILLGLAKLYRSDKRALFAFSAMFLSVLFVLSFQRNWIEGDKYRIIICAFLPLYIFMAFGLKYILNKRKLFKRCAYFIIALLLPFIFVQLISAYSFRADENFFTERKLYQKESPEYYDLTRQFFVSTGILPNYRRLFTKTDLSRKRKEEALALKRLFPEKRLPRYERFENFYNTWERSFASVRESTHTGKSLEENEENYIYVKVDFEKLVTDLENSVEAIESVDIASIDLKNKDELFDVYYSPLNVSWQDRELLVCIMPGEHAKYLNELHVELNAFTSFGKDDMGLDVVNSVNFMSDPASSARAYRTGMISFPLYIEENSMVFRIPENMKVIVRNWFINGENGTPYKLDSWCIKRQRSGDYKAEFFYNEQESYL